VSHAASHENLANAQAAHAAHARTLLTKDNITFPAGAGAGKGTMLLGAGAVMVAAAAGMGYAGVGGVWARQALAAYHVGAMAVLAMCLGSLFFVMVFHLTNAGWTGTIRRQFENVMSFLPFAFLLVLPTLAIEIARSHTNDGHLFAWLTPEAAKNHELQQKWTYFFGPLSEPGTAGAFPGFFVLRALIYGCVWTYLSRKLLSLSRRQDETGDRMLTAQARFISAWGMLIFALTTAFAAFDWLMSLDYRFFSTMWGVYYFAGAAFSSSALVAIILAVLRSKGKLMGAVTEEHFHDLGKLMLTFTVFWGYIGFSQYFLIWYSNIPEETAFYNFRASPQWLPWGRLLIAGHFVVPFLILLFRPVKRSPKALILMALWAIALEVVDLYWIVRPMVYGHEPTPGPMAYVVDLLGIVGVLVLFAGYLVRAVPKGLLVAINDPRIEEAMGHKNYV
jgi:hypothetical protein